MTDQPKFGEVRKARLLVPLSHTNRHCHPTTKMYAIGDEIEVRWLHNWRMTDGLRGLGGGFEGKDFEFV